MPERPAPTPPPARPGKITRYQKAKNQVAAAPNSSPPRKDVHGRKQHDTTPAKAARQEVSRRSPMKRHILNATATQVARAGTSGRDTRTAETAREEDVSTQVAVAGHSRVDPSPSKRMRVQPPPDKPVRRVACFNIMADPVESSIRKGRAGRPGRSTQTGHVCRPLTQQSKQ